MMPSVSIVIPTYNREHLIGAAIDSCLQQSLANLQIIIVDDGSTDNTAKVVQGFADRVEYHCLHDNSGAQVARNVGMELASGEYLKFFDSDDRLEPDSLAKELQLAERENADIVVSNWASIGLNGERLYQSAPKFGQGEQIIDDVLHGKAAQTSAALYRTTYLREHKVAWNPDLLKLDDWHFFAMAALGLGKIVHSNLLAYWQLAHPGPRLTNVSMLENAVDHHAVLAELERALEQQGKLTQERKERLAIYHFKELQVMSRFDRSRFLNAVDTIERLAPDLDPREAFANPVLGWLARLVGTRRALNIYAKLRP